MKSPQIAAFFLPLHFYFLSEISMFCGDLRPVGAVILGFVNFLVWWGLGRRRNSRIWGFLMEIWWVFDGICMGISTVVFYWFLMGFPWGFDEGFFGGPNGDWMGCFMVFEDFKAFKEDLKGLNADFCGDWEEFNGYLTGHTPFFWDKLMC